MANKVHGQIDEQKSLILSLVVANKPGVLGRIALVFSRRGFNIEHLTVHHTLDQRFSHMTVISQGDEERFQEIIKQTRKIVDVIYASKTQQNTEDQNTEQKKLRLAIHCEAESKQIVLQCLQYSSFRIFDFTADALMVEKANEEYTDEAMLTILRQYATIQVLPEAGDPKSQLKKGVDE